MRHHFRHPQAMFSKGSLFYSHCAPRVLLLLNFSSSCSLVLINSLFSGLEAEAGHIRYLRILYPIHIQALKKDMISFHHHAKKRIWIYILYPLPKILPRIFTVSEQQKARPGSTEAHKSSTFYRIELKP
jgi:hypothetical protein